MINIGKIGPNIYNSHWNVYIDLSSKISQFFSILQVKTFFKNRPLGSNVRSIMQGTERIEQNIDFLSKYEGKISNWLKSRKNLLCTVKN